MRGQTWHRLALVGAVLVFTLFIAMIGDLVWQSLGVLSWHFLWSPPSEMGHGGIGPELLNTLVMVGIAALISLPLGLAGAIFRVEYRGAPGFLKVFDRVRFTFLSLPTIVIGLLVYQWVVVELGWPLSIRSGIVALVVMNWPFVVNIGIEALSGVPDTSREASMALGATSSQTLMRIVFPSALPALIAGLGVSTARLLGESAALIFTAGINVAVHWSWSMPGETLAVHLWYLRTESLAPHANAEAAATGVVLLGLVALVLYLTQKIAHWLKPRDYSRKSA